MNVMGSGPHGFPVATVTLKRSQCGKCGRGVRLTLLRSYHDRTGARWCLPCVRQRYPAPRG